MYRMLRLGTKAFASNFKVLDQPYKLTFAITYSCNSKCKTCGIWKIKSKNELTTEEIKKIFEKINPSWVNLTGGETFLRNDLFEIAKIISKRDVYLFNITTNGLLVNETLKTVKKIFNLKIPKFVLVVSLDGPKEIHDDIKGIDGNWEKSVNLFSKLKNLSKAKKSFNTYFGYTVSKYNAGQIQKTLDAVNKKIDVKIDDFHFNIFHKCFYYNNEDLDDVNDLSNKIIKDINYLKEVKKNIGAIPFLEKKYIKFIDKYLATSESPLPCKALHSSCFIDPYGNVYPCTHFDTKIGNLRNNNYNLINIWNSEKAKETRKSINQNKCDGCWTPCEAYQTILGNLF